MTDKIRMSDVFGGLDFNYGYYREVETWQGETFKADDDNDLVGLIFFHQEPADAVMHAINNHDSMQDRIAQLENDKAELAKLANTLNAWLLIDGEYRDSPLRETAEGILSKHKEGE